MPYNIDGKKMARNTVALYLRTIITMLISFFTTRVTLEVLGSEDYGLNNLVGGVVSLFSFLNGSMATAVQRYFNIAIGQRKEDELGRIYGVGRYLHIMVALITTIIAEIFAIFFLDKMNIPQERMFAAHVVFQISIISMALNIMNVPNYALLKAHEKFDVLAKLDIIRAFLRLGILYLLCLIDMDKLILLSLLGFCVTLYYVLTLYIKARFYPEAHHPICRDKVLIKQMLSFISFLIITVLAEMLRKQGLIMLINIFFGLAVNAAYAIAAQISFMVSTFVINIKQPIIPQMMAAYGAGDRKSMFRLISFGTKVTFLMMLILSLPIIFEIDWILEFWLKEPPANTSILAILVLVNINIASFTYFLYQGVHATGNIRIQQIWMSSLYLANVAFIYLAFVLGAEYTYALYITICISMAQCLLNLICAKKYYGYSIRSFVFQSTIPCIIVAIIVSVVLWSITAYFPSSIWRAISVFMIGLILCSGLGYRFLFNKDERLQAVSMLKRIIKK